MHAWSSCTLLAHHQASTVRIHARMQLAQADLHGQGRAQCSVAASHHGTALTVCLYPYGQLVACLSMRSSCIESGLSGKVN